MGLYRMPKALFNLSANNRFFFSERIELDGNLLYKKKKYA